MSAKFVATIVIPVFNGAAFLAEAIDSALAQTWPEVEVLVVNDGSTDGGATARVAARYGSRIRYFEKANGGVSSALNVGIREMRGEWFCWLSHDDVYLPRRVEAAVRWLSDHPGNLACYSDYRLVRADLGPIGDVACPWFPRDEALRAMMGRHYIGGCTVTVQRTVFDRVGLFDESLRLAQDLEMWLRMLYEIELGHVSEVLVLTRVHRSQGSVQHEERMVRQGLGVVRRFLEVRGLPGVCPPLLGSDAKAKDKARALVHVGDNLLQGRRSERLALEYYREAVDVWPAPWNCARLRFAGWVRLGIMEANWKILLLRFFPRLVRGVQRLRGHRVSGASAAN